MSCLGGANNDVLWADPAGMTYFATSMGVFGLLHGSDLHGQELAGVLFGCQPGELPGSGDQNRAYGAQVSSSSVNHTL